MSEDFPPYVRPKAEDSKAACVYCNKHRVSVIDSRITADNIVRRRRICLDCGRRWTTYEHTVDELILPETITAVRARLIEISAELKALGDKLASLEPDDDR